VRTPCKVRAAMSTVATMKAMKGFVDPWQLLAPSPCQDMLHLMTLPCLEQICGMFAIQLNSLLTRHFNVKFPAPSCGP